MRRWVVSLGVAGLTACSAPAAPVGASGQCMLTTDCQAGLVCIPQKNGPNVCSSNLATIVSTEEAGAAAPQDAAPGDGKAAGDARAPVDGGAPMDATTTTPPSDSGKTMEDAPAPPDDVSSPTPEAEAPETSSPADDAASE